jgi:glycosyltransferase involved in cell wall biosynthesis
LQEWADPVFIEPPDRLMVFSRMNIWFVHKNFPGQYRRLAPFFAKRRDCSVVGIGEVIRQRIEGARHYTYEAPEPSSTGTHGYVWNLETGVRRGIEAARLALKLKQQGLRPDIVCSHPGWGDTLYFREVFPDAKFLSYQEFFYRPAGSDLGFDPEFAGKSKLDAMCRVRTKNAVNLLSLDLADWNVCPTHWQRAQFPEEFQPKMSVIHDGIDTKVARPDRAAKMSLKGRLPISLSTHDEVITFSVRNLEPYRGFHIFMRALPELMRRRPKAHILVAGGDEVSYGIRLPEGMTYRQMLFEEVRERIDADRLHFLGRLPYEQFLTVLQISSAHVYLTYPFVLSWSMLEAMAAECLVVASKTPPVEEILVDGENGLLFDFFSPEALSETVCRALDDRDLARTLRKNARATIVANYDFESVCLPRQVELIEQVASGATPAS